MTATPLLILLRDHAAGRHAVRPEPACRSCAVATVHSDSWVVRAREHRLKAKELRP